MAGGLKGMGRLPRDTVRARRNATKLASDFVSVLGDGLTVVAGEIVVDLAADKGLGFIGGDLATIVAAPIALDATGIHLDYTTGLTLDGTDLVLDILGLTTDTIAAGDWVPFHDLADAPNKIAFSDFEATLNHDALANYAALEHIDWTDATDNFKTTGTLEAEHLYSTDDAIINDDLRVNGNVGIGIAPTAIRSINIYYVGATGSYSGIYTNVRDTKNINFEARKVYGGTYYARCSGTVDLASNELYGGWYSVTDSQTVQNAGATNDIFGIYGSVFSTLTQTAGASRHYGCYFLVVGDMGVVGTTEKYGFYSSVSGTADKSYGAWISVSGATNNYGLVLDGDGLAGGVIFGDGQDASMYYDGTDLHINSHEVGSGHIILDTPKTTTGDPAGVEGKIYWNTVDNVIKMYADGAWRTLASW